MNPNEENQPPVPPQNGTETSKTQDTVQEVIGMPEQPVATPVEPPDAQPDHTVPSEQAQQHPVVQPAVEDKSQDVSVLEQDQVTQTTNYAIEESNDAASTEVSAESLDQTDNELEQSQGEEQQSPTEPSAQNDGSPEVIAPQTEQVSSSVANAQDTVEGSQASPFKKRLLFLLAPALIIITLLGILVASQVFSGGLKLATYSGDTFSIKYPAGYEEATEKNATAFKEAGETSDETLSGVIVAMDDLPADISDQQRNLIKEKLPEQVDAFLTTATAGGENEIRNETTEDTTLAGSEAKRVTADIYKDEQKVGTFYISSGLTQKKLVLVAVLAHTSDPELDAKAREILNSFELKQ